MRYLREQGNFIQNFSGQQLIFEWTICNLIPGQIFNTKTRDSPNLRSSFTFGSAFSVYVVPTVLITHQTFTTLTVPLALLVSFYAVHTHSILEEYFSISFCSMWSTFQKQCLARSKNIPEPRRQRVKPLHRTLPPIHGNYFGQFWKMSIYNSSRTVCTLRKLKFSRRRSDDYHLCDLIWGGQVNSTHHEPILLSMYSTKVGAVGHQMSKYTFLMHSWRINRFLTFTYWINNWSIGVAWSVLMTYFIFLNTSLLSHLLSH